MRTSDAIVLAAWWLLEKVWVWRLAYYLGGAQEARKRPALSPKCQNPDRT